LRGGRCRGRTFRAGNARQKRWREGKAGGDQETREHGAAQPFEIRMTMTVWPRPASQFCPVTLVELWRNKSVIIKRQSSRTT
jgi:hypothetical protein